ncbi:MAG: polyprenyl synthetase family protein [Bacteroides sp.]|nr:polyprenyl synthetase family protein [Bacteroides sp.]
MIESENLLQLISEGVERLSFPHNLPGLYEPIRYTLEAGGKRLRPLLTLAACQACGVSAEEALNQALGIEMFHNFTLLHDDVMDRAETRRGRPTVHMKWNTPTAILSGDAMLTLSTQLVSKCPAEKLPEVLNLFNRTAIEIYEGQQMDMDFESRTDVTVDEYLQMIRLKTGVLLGCAAAMGAIMAHASEQTVRAFYDFGVNLGLAFQLQDDYLDTFGDAETFGKAIGGDIRNDKKTWLLISAMNEAAEEIEPWLGQEPTEEKVEAVTEIYRRLNLPAAIHQLIDDYTVASIDSLASAGLPAQAFQWFQDLTADLTNRKH